MEFLYEWWSYVTKPLSIIYKNCIQQGFFPDDWKKGDIIPVQIQKNNSKQIVNNYRPVSLLPTCSKIFEKLIIDNIYNFINKNNFFNNNQSGFRPIDSWIHQLVAITHNIFNAFNANPSLEVRGVFPQHFRMMISFINARVMELNGNLFKLIKSFSNKRYQRVVLNGQCSVWKLVTAVVPECSLLGPSFFSSSH